MQRIAKRSATGNCSARNALSLLPLGRIGALEIVAVAPKREYEKLQFVELKSARGLDARCDPCEIAAAEVGKICTDFHARSRRFEALPRWALQHAAATDHATKHCSRGKNDASSSPVRRLGYRRVRTATYDVDGDICCRKSLALHLAAVL